MSDLDQIEPGQDSGLIAQHPEKIEPVAAQLSVVRHHHHAVIAIKEGFQDRGGLHQGFRKIAVAAFRRQRFKPAEDVVHR